MSVFCKSSVNFLDTIWISTAIREKTGDVWSNVENEQRETALKSRKTPLRKKVNIEVAALGSDCYFSFWSSAEIFLGRFIFSRSNCPGFENRKLIFNR